MWTTVITDVKHNRLSHTSTQVGSYLFILGGHNGQCYAQDVLLFNLGMSSFIYQALHPFSSTSCESKEEEGNGERRRARAD